MKKLLPFGVMQYSYSMPSEKSYFDAFFEKLDEGEVFAYFRTGK
jgi:hypothetical protein